jgi:hypothetical protein
MPFTGTFFAPDLEDLIKRVMEAACSDLRSRGHDDSPVARSLMTVALITAVGAGERNEARLKGAALQASDSR